MKLAASTLSLPALDHLSLLPRLRQLGLTGLEVIPGRAWADPWHGLSGRDVTAYRYATEEAGLRIVGLDGLLVDRPELGLFQGPEATRQTVDYLVHLSAVCRDLGGRSLILGEPRRRGALAMKEAWAACQAFLDALLPRIEDHGTVLCFEPLEPADGDFCITSRECRLLVDYVDHPAFGLHLSAKAQTANGETGHASFCVVRGRLDHFHADEPELAILGHSQKVDHADFRRHLAAISYRDWVTLKQKMTPAPLEGLTQGCQILTQCYLRGDNLSLIEKRHERRSRQA